MSYQYIFHGRVIPERAGVQLAGLDWIEIIQPDTGIKFKLNFTIYHSIINATVIAEEEIKDIYTLKNILFNSISLHVDSIGYGNGCGYLVEIISCLYDNGNRVIIFGVNIDELSNKKNIQWESSIGIMKALSKADSTQQPQLQRALADFKKGIVFSQDTGLYAYRAIESIKVAFSDSWEEMNYLLNINKTYTDDLRKNHGNLQRHGKHSFMSGDERTDMLKRSKTIISRFATYINNDNKPLKTPEFQKLV